MTTTTTYLQYTTTHDEYGQPAPIWWVLHRRAGRAGLDPADSPRYRHHRGGQVVHERTTCGPECPGHGSEHIATTILGTVPGYDAQAVWDLIRADARQRYGLELDPRDNGSPYYYVDGEPTPEFAAAVARRAKRARH